MESFQILGILNLTEDSFSDGGKFLETSSALAQAKFLLESGADILDLGAQSSNIHSKPVSIQTEWKRIETIWDLIISQGLRTSTGRIPKISIDSFRPEILRKSLLKRLDYWNDITAFKDPRLLEILLDNKEHIPECILMFSTLRGNRAEIQNTLKSSNIIENILNFFTKAKEDWIRAGIPEAKIIIDPGMGFFLGEESSLSTTVLKNIPRFKKELGRILVSVSRKSFIGSILGNLPPLERKSGTLAAEIYSYVHGVDFIRTHEPKPLLEAIKVWYSIEKSAY
jgi:dihydropteroate synthase